MSKDLFDQILAAIEDSPDDVPPSILAGIKTKDPHIREDLRHYYDYNNILLVMNSSIFHEGSLRGKSLRGETPIFKLYPITDLTYFILRTSILLARKDREEIFKDSISCFDTGMDKIEELKCVAQFYRSWISFKKLENMKQELANIKSILLSKPSPNKLHFRLDKTDRHFPDRIDQLIQLFEEQIPEAPSFTTGRAIHKLLSLFGIPSTEAAITQRIYRKK